MWKFREILSLALLIALIWTVIYRIDRDKSSDTTSSGTPPTVEHLVNDGPNGSNESNPAAAPAVPAELVARTPTMPEMIFYAQARLLVGAKSYFDDAERKLAGTPGGLPAGTQATIKSTLENSLTTISLASERASGNQTAAQRESLRFLVRKQLIVAHQLAIEPPPNITSALESEERSEVERRLDEVLLPLITSDDPAPSDAPNLSEDERALLIKQLGWFGELLISEGMAKEQLLQSSQDSFTSFLVGLFVFIGAIFVGLIVLIWIFVRFARGTTTWKFIQAEIHPVLCLETFLLYMGAMLGLSYVLLWLMPRGLGELLSTRYGSASTLAANAIGILSIVVIAAWPLIWRAPLKSVGRSFGMYISDVGTFLRDLTIAPLTYLAAIVPLIVTMMIYAKSLDALGIDISQGAHPVIPMLLSEGNAELIWWVVFLAVVVAPIVEEVFFRGALYSYSRARLGRWSSIFLTSIIFAAIHPQGVVGIVPLTAIGCVLAFLREWRNSLVAPILAHACFNGVTLFLVTKIFLP